MIAFHYVNRAQLKGRDEVCAKAWAQGTCPFENMEQDLMTKIKQFCKNSKDPFFQNTLYGYIQGCQTREDILKYFAPLRDETKIDEEMGELASEAEEAYQRLNEKLWVELKTTVKKYFDRPKTLEQFIEITSDTFDIPYSPEDAQ